MWILVYKEHSTGMYMLGLRKVAILIVGNTSINKYHLLLIVELLILNKILHCRIITITRLV